MSIILKYVVVVMILSLTGCLSTSSSQSDALLYERNANASSTFAPVSTMLSLKDNICYPTNIARIHYPSLLKPHRSLKFNSYELCLEAGGDFYAGTHSRLSREDLIDKYKNTIMISTTINGTRIPVTFAGMLDESRFYHTDLNNNCLTQVQEMLIAKSLEPVRVKKNHIGECAIVSGLWYDELSNEKITGAPKFYFALDPNTVFYTMKHRIPRAQDVYIFSALNDLTNLVVTNQPMGVIDHNVSRGYGQPIASLMPLTSFPRNEGYTCDYLNRLYRYMLKHRIDMWSITINYPIMNNETSLNDRCSSTIQTNKHRTEKPFFTPLLSTDSSKSNGQYYIDGDEIADSF